MFSEDFFDIPLFQPDQNSSDLQLDEKNRKTINKIRSQEYRKRRKQYIQNLEQKNKLLQEENTLLKQEIQSLKANARDSSGHSSSKSDWKSKVDLSENFAFYQLPTMVKKNKESVRFSQLAMAAFDACNWNPNRIQVIKNSFNDIINYIIAKDAKCLVSAFKNMKPSEYLKKVNNKRSYKARYKELMDQSPREILLNQKLSDPLTTYLNNYGSDFFKNLKDCGRLV
ncbi:unnamed protein product [Moneuplotes crassus]|uniref:BZIP domain-containing protein n=1 Tax=Euplotes crassus TaxID=5936 RepID=A0AAD2D043_EUPCR|nr:unnamed protein product [Moneuplotes crassus]